MVETKAFWTGSCNLGDVCFHNAMIPTYEEKHLQNQINSIWDDFKKMYPESYNGTLVNLEAIEHEEELENQQCHLFFKISYMNYATLIGLMKLEMPIQHYGALGTQVAIFDESEQYILVGRRKLDQFYAPGLLTVPGGVLEKEDVFNPSVLLLRELQEEVPIKVKEPKIIALLAEHTNYSTIIFIKAILDQPFTKDAILTETENEFHKHKLFWMKKETLKDLKSEDLMEGLTYIKENLI